MPLSISDYAAHLRAEREAFNRQLIAEGYQPRPIEAPRVARLLLLACSATKHPAPGPLPIRERYRGPLWLTLNAADRAGERAQVVAVSAEFGFVTDWQEIPHYELRLSAAAGEALAAEIRAGFPGASAGGSSAAAHAARRLSSRAMNCLAAIHEAATKAEKPLEEIALCGGGAYLPPMRAAVAAAAARGWIAPGAQVVEICATIGRMRQQLRAWLGVPVTVAGDSAEPVAPAPEELPAEPAPATVAGDAPAPVTPAEEPAHLTGLRAALARVERQRRELEEGAELEAQHAVSRWRDAQIEGWRTYSCSAVLRSGVKRRQVEEILEGAREAITGRRAAQLLHLARKAHRIGDAIAAAEEKLLRLRAEEEARRRHNGGPALAPEEAAGGAEASRAPSHRAEASRPLAPFLARPRGQLAAPPPPHPARHPARGATAEERPA